jgi:hypothetical protein
MEGADWASLVVTLSPCELCNCCANTRDGLDGVSAMKVIASRIIERITGQIYVFWKEYLGFGKLLP